MKHLNIFTFTVLFLLISSPFASTESAPVSYVDQFIGTGEHEQTFPGTTLPLDWCNPVQIQGLRNGTGVQGITIQLLQLWVLAKTT